MAFHENGRVAACRALETKPDAAQLFVVSSDVALNPHVLRNGGVP